MRGASRLAGDLQRAAPAVIGRCGDASRFLEAKLVGAHAHYVGRPGVIPSLVGRGYRTAMQSISTSNGPGHDGTCVKMRAGDLFGK